MKFIRFLIRETCPDCHEALVSSTSLSHSHIIKSCPQCQYAKEFHPALETYVEK